MRILILPVAAVAGWAMHRCLQWYVRENPFLTGDLEAWATDHPMLNGHQ